MQILMNVTVLQMNIQHSYMKKTFINWPTPFLGTESKDGQCQAKENLTQDSFEKMIYTFQMSVSGRDRSDRGVSSTINEQFGALRGTATPLKKH